MVSVFAKIGLINSVVAAFLGLQIIIRNRHSVSNRAFAFLAATIALWSFGYWRWLSISDGINVGFWINFFTLFSNLIPVAYFYWIISLLGLNKKYIKAIWVLVGLSVVLIYSTFYTDLLVRGVQQKSIFPYWPIPGKLYLSYISVIYLGLVGWGLIVLLRNYLSSDSKDVREQIRFVLVGSLVGFGGGLTNFFLWYNIFIPPYLNFLVAIGLIIFYYAASTYHLFEAKVIATEFFAYIIAITMAVRLIFSETKTDYLVNGIILLAVGIFSLLLVKSTRKEIEQKEQLQELTGQLKKTNDQLEELSKFKSQLLSLASHQLKSPMAAIKGFATILIEGLYGPVSDKVKETIEKMRKSADDQLALINTLLDLRRVEEGKMEYQFATSDLNQLVKEKLDELKPLASQKGLDLNYESDDTPVWISADGPKLKQVIQNFVDNAIKYAPKGFVHVTLHKDGEYAVFSVIDSGLGVPAELLPHLFEEFVRDERVKTQILGTGFGLYIARKIMEAHGGTIWAESDGANKGSRFHFKMRTVPQYEVQKQARLAAASITNKHDGM